VEKEIAGYFLGRMATLCGRGRSDMIPEPTIALIGRDKIEEKGKSKNKYKRKMKRVIKFYWIWLHYPGSDRAGNVALSCPTYICTSPERGKRRPGNFLESEILTFRPSID
jgi:hypothetical protein